MARGRWFSDVEMRRAKPVAVVGPTLAERLFRFHDPLGKYIRIGSKPFRVIGVIEPTITSDAEEALKRDRAAYIPVSTVRERFGERNVKRSSGSMEIEKVELHQILVRLKSMADVLPVATAVEELLDQRHDQDDFEIDVPLALLREAREAAARDKRLFGAIAGISLLVGGIGIMNIMLASVTERTREIGVRRALGAMRRDITFQFLVETLILSLLGGVIGIVLGIVACELYTWWGKGETIITPISIALSFGISGAVGILAGLYPAMRAARMDPITALRHE
jgi:putative ABC transport system permease protein